jgi:hypothetical protein
LLDFGDRLSHAWVPIIKATKFSPEFCLNSKHFRVGGFWK